VDAAGADESAGKGVGTGGRGRARARAAAAVRRFGARGREKERKEWRAHT